MTSVSRGASASGKGGALILWSMVSGAVHALQNFALGRFVAPHAAHRTANGAAHSSQNFASSGFSEAQFEHRIEAPARRSIPSS
jgi:hypothetical protein